MDKNEGTITVFAFAEGQRLSTHSAPFDALVEIIEGTGTITIEGVEHEVKNGQQIIGDQEFGFSSRTVLVFKKIHGWRYYRMLRPTS
jgi:mannose-6-phosphate isomerase-like protein (cupin superfamily)